MDIMRGSLDCGKLYLFRRLVYEADNTSVPSYCRHLDTFGRIFNHTDGAGISENRPHIPAEKGGQSF